MFFGRNKINKINEHRIIKKTIEKLSHRGPDGSGFIIDRNIWLASTRLSIIDTSRKGLQPLQNENKTIYLVFNGEIYNYRELKDKYLKNHKFRSATDAEILLHLYEEFGVGCLRQLRGMFAFALWDSRKKVLFLARDRFGKKPLKYFFNSEFFVFASELKAFIDWPDVPKKIDYGAIDEFLTYSYVPAPKTGFMNVYKLPPASYMMVTPDGKKIIRKYWELDFSHKINISENEWKERLFRELQSAVRLRLSSDVPLGLHLSGGIDSSLVTALACRESKNKMRTFTVGFGTDESEDFYYAGLIASKYKTEHIEINIEPEWDKILSELSYYYEEPFGDPSAIPTYFLMRESRKYMTVALNGDGGDENFAGYPRYMFMKFFYLWKNMPFKKDISGLLKFLYLYIDRKDFAILGKYLGYPFSYPGKYYEKIMSCREYYINIYEDSFKSKIKGSRRGELINGYFKDRGEGRDLTDNLLYTDVRTYLSDYLLVKTDIAGMSNSLEVRSPFLDHQFMELTAKMPAMLKLKFLKSKYMLKKMADDYLPVEIITRRKKGFLPPLKKWLEKSRYGVIPENFSRESFGRYEIFKQSFLDSVLEDHFSRREENGYLIWNILVLKKWLDRWFAGGISG